MYLAQFLENPIGKGDASIPNKTLILGALRGKYDTYTNGSLGKKKAVEMKVYRNAASDEYYFWLVMPTETKRDNTYDVVFKFYDKDKTHKMDLSINKYDFQVFANTPSFAYTYAYVYKNAGLMIPFLENKLGRRILSDSPDVRNRNQNIMYDKYIYFAARYILESKKMNRVTLEMIAKPYDEKYIFSHIRTLDKIMDEYRIAEDKLKKKEKKSTDKERKPKFQSTSATGNKSSIRVVSSRSKILNTVDAAAHKKTPIQKRRGTVKKK